MILFRTWCYLCSLLFQLCYVSTQTNVTDSDILNLILENSTFFDKSEKNYRPNNSDSSFFTTEATTIFPIYSEEECKNDSCKNNMHHNSLQSDSSSSTFKVLWNLVSTVKSVTNQYSDSDETSGSKNFYSPSSVEIPSTHSTEEDDSIAYNISLHSNANELDSEINYENFDNEDHNLQSREGITDNTYFNRGYMSYNYSNRTEQPILMTTEFEIQNFNVSDGNDTYDDIISNYTDKALDSNDDTSPKLTNSFSTTDSPFTTLATDNELDFTTYFVSLLDTDKKEFSTISDTSSDNSDKRLSTHEPHGKNMFENTNSTATESSVKLESTVENIKSESTRNPDVSYSSIKEQSMSESSSVPNEENFNTTVAYFSASIETGSSSESTLDITTLKPPSESMLDITTLESSNDKSLITSPNNLSSNESETSAESYEMFTLTVDELFPKKTETQYITLATTKSVEYNSSIPNETQLLTTQASILLNHNLSVESFNNESNILFPSHEVPISDIINNVSVNSYIITTTTDAEHNETLTDNLLSSSINPIINEVFLASLETSTTVEDHSSALNEMNNHLSSIQTTAPPSLLPEYTSDISSTNTDSIFSPLIVTQDLKPETNITSSDKTSVTIVNVNDNITSDVSSLPVFVTSSEKPSIAAEKDDDNFNITENYKTVTTEITSNLSSVVIPETVSTSSSSDHYFSSGAATTASVMFDSKSSKSSMTETITESSSDINANDSKTNTFIPEITKEFPHSESEISDTRGDSENYDTIFTSTTDGMNIITSPIVSDDMSTISDTHREGKHIPFSSTSGRSTTNYPRIFSVTVGTYSRQPHAETTKKEMVDLLYNQIKAEDLSPEERSNLINAVVKLPDKFYTKEELNEKIIIIHLWLLRAIADEYRNATLNLSESNNELDDVEFENLPQILYVLPTPEIFLPNLTFTFVVLNKWRNETFPVDIVITILNLHIEDLKHLVEIEEIHLSHGLLIQDHDLLSIIIEKYGVVLLATCVITVGMIFLLVCVVIYYRRKTRQSAHCLTDDKLHRNMQEAMGIDLNPAVVILQEEIREKAALNGNKISSIDDDDGWLAPIGDVPVAEDNNAPFVQDTKL